MINVDEIKKFLECATMTGFLKGDVPVSIFMIAKPETGKSELIKIMRGYPNTFYTNELSFKGFLDYVIPEIENGKATHVLIPDFINIVSHRRAAETLVPLLNSAMAEGIKDLKFFGSKKEFNKPIYAGLITGITKEEFDKRIIYWKNIGFLTRMIVITFAYCETTRLQIHEHIRKGNGHVEDLIKFPSNFDRFKTKSFEIKIPDSIAFNIEMLATTLATNNSTYVLKTTNEAGAPVQMHLNIKSYGFRLHNLLRSLVKGICLYHGEGNRFEVNKEDFEQLVKFIKYINFMYTEV